jgi:hypothetical protein
MANYKFPACWLGKSRSIISEDSEAQTKIFTEADINPRCLCLNEMQAFFCSEGHLTECHVGMTCEEAECSHYEAEHLEYGEEDIP